MHIAIDVRSLMEGRHSGVEEYTYQIIRALVRVGSRHVYHAFLNAAKPVRMPLLPRGVRVHRLYIPNSLFNFSQWSFGMPTWDSLILRSMRGGRIDAVFVPNPRITPLSYNIPLVCVVHDLSFERFPEFLTMRRRLWHSLMRPQLLIKNSDRVIAVSNHTKRDLVELYHIQPSKISVIYPGVNEEVKAPRAAEVQRVLAKYGLSRRYVLSFGTLEPRKNVVGVLAAYDNVAGEIPHDLVVAGEGGWKEKSILNTIVHMKYSHRVRMLGFIPDDEKCALYAGADVFVYPSFYEGFGFPPLESLLCGTPVITSFNSSLPEVVGRWATLVDPYSLSQLAAVLIDHMSHPRVVTHAIQEEVRSTYSWDESARKILTLIEGAV